MRIGCLQFAPQLGDVDNNLTRADGVLSKSRPENLDLLVLPELAFTGKPLYPSSTVSLVSISRRCRTTPRSFDQLHSFDLHAKDVGCLVLIFGLIWTVLRLVMLCAVTTAEAALLVCMNVGWD